jgi:hypothetical protein
MQDAIGEKKLHKPPIGFQKAVSPDCLECSSHVPLTKFSDSHVDTFIVIS